MRRILLAASLASVVAANACASILGIRDVPDAAPADVAAPDAMAPDGGGYSDLGDTTKWTTFDLQRNVNANATGFIGAAFDGRYVYFAPNAVPNDAGQRIPDGLVARLDTRADFATPAAWQTYDLAAQVDARLIGFKGAVFDGRFVYFVPYYNAGFDGVIVRYDTTVGFQSASAWTPVFDAQKLGGAAIGFVSGVFDGRHVYLVPHQTASPSTFDGLVAQYSVGGALDDAASWSTFDVTQLDPNALAFAGGVFDGRYVYLVPNVAAVVARYDTLASFGAKASWSTFDLATRGGASMWGGAFDGRYVYFVPSPGGVAARYDTQGALDGSASWATFDMSKGLDQRAKGFRGAAFDGRFVYFAPNAADVVTRYDTTAASFSAPDAWSSFDMGPIDLSITGFEGAVFDGRYVYFVPNSNGVVARFDARSPPATPLALDGSAHGSFF